MAFTNPDATFLQQAERVNTLYQRVGDIRDRTSSSETDTRHVNLNNVMMAANASMATLRLLDWAKRGGDGVLIQALGMARPEYINLVAEDLLRSSRLFLLLESQFQIETLFQNILLTLGRRADKQGYYNVARDLIAAAGLADPDMELRVLNVPALMRNSMHSNGIHHGWNGTDTVEVINGVEFHFQHGKRVQCGSWYHIVTALLASFDVVDEVLTSNPVKDLAEIPDRYSEQAASRNG
jgi:hypothetical protein